MMYVIVPGDFAAVILASEPSQPILHLGNDFGLLVYGECKIPRARNDDDTDSNRAIYALAGRASGC